LLSRGAILLDVRSQDEYDVWHLDGSINAPFFTLRMQVKTLSRDKPVVVVCANGKVSEAAAFLLLRNKIKAIILHGGMENIAPELKITHQAQILRATPEAALFKIDDGVETLVELADIAHSDNNSDIIDQAPDNGADYDNKLLLLEAENKSLKQSNAELSHQYAKLRADKDNSEKQILLMQQQILKLTQMVNSLKELRD